ncbi:MAG TPA: VWA domain-containing protein [Ktedonobacteraceae bacterium]
MSQIDQVHFAGNPDPVCPCVLLLDTSTSMHGASITALNEGLRTFYQDVQSDDLAHRRVEVAVITFGNGGVQMLQNFTKIARAEIPTLTAGGNTPMGTAIGQALDIVKERKSILGKGGIPYYRPWMVLITDGAPTDDWQAAAERVRQEESAGGLSFFAIGVGEADMETLAKIAVRQPLKLHGLSFKEFFLWLSASQKRVSASQPGEQVPLPPPKGWAMV